MKVIDIRKLQNREIERMLEDRRRSLMDLRFKKVVGSLNDPSQMRVIRTDIARIKTVLREREIIGEQQGEAPVAAASAPAPEAKPEPADADKAKEGD